MNQKQEKMLEKMKEKTIGVEVEMYGANEMTIASYVAEYFNSTYELTSYDHDSFNLRGYVVKDSQGRKWRVVHDSSLPDGRSGELVTPVLKYDDIENLQSLIRHLRSKGLVSNARHGCGVHIHVGANYGLEGGHTVQSLINLANYVNNHQYLLKDAIGFSNDRYRYCGEMNQRFIEAINVRGNKTYEQLEYLWYTSCGSRVPQGPHHYDNSRYQILNYHSLFNKVKSGKPEQATTEFRCFEFHKNMHAGELKAYIQLCLAMVVYSQNVKYIGRKPIERIDNPKNSVKNWLTNMGLTGEEFKTCRKMLTKRLSGDMACRHERPHVDVDAIDM